MIGQGGPTDEQFVSLWTQLAAKYKGSERVVFGLMNEPHDVDIARWAVTVQALVTAIRNAGATAQMRELYTPFLTLDNQYFPLQLSSWTILT